MVDYRLDGFSVFKNGKKRGGKKGRKKKYTNTFGRGRNGSNNSNKKRSN